MSFLFDKKTQKAIKWVWMVISVIIIASMVIVYTGSGAM
jgi:predicted nucleic acid-binding Zn ribbon protein